MSFVRFLQRSRTLSSCYLRQSLRCWNVVLISQFSCTHRCSIHQLPASLQFAQFLSLHTKHYSHLQAAAEHTSKSSEVEQRETYTPAGSHQDPDVAVVLREMALVSEEVSKLGVPPGADDSSVKVVNRFEEMVEVLTPLQLYHVVFSFPSMPEAIDVVRQPIVSRFQKSMRHLSISQLVRVVQSRKVLCLDDSVFESALNLIQQRWVEIKSSRDVVTLLYVVANDSTQFLERLEDLALDLCDAMTVKELYRTMYCLARRHRRNAPLVRALAYYLDRQQLDLSPVHLSNLAFAMAVLNVHDRSVMEKLVTAVCEVVEDRNQSPDVVRHMLSSVIQSLGILRWFDRRLMDLTADWFRRLKVDAADWARLLHTLAWVNYLPPMLSKDGLEGIVKRIWSLSESSPLLWLDVVWSCNILDLFNAELAASVLHPEFVSKLEGEYRRACRQGQVFFSGRQPLQFSKLSIRP